MRSRCNPMSTAASRIGRPIRAAALAVLAIALLILLDLPVAASDPLKSNGRRQLDSRFLIAESGDQDGASLPPPQGEFRPRLRGRRFTGAQDGFPPGQGAMPPADEGPGSYQGTSMPSQLPGAFAEQRRFRGGTFGGLGAAPFAGGRFRGRQPGFGGRPLLGGPIDLTPLNLSDEQKQQIRQLRSRNGPRARELRETLRSKRTELRDLMFDPNATDAQIRAKRQEVRQMQDQLEETIMGDFLSLRSLLSPDQRRRLPECKPVLRQARAFKGEGPASPGPGQPPALPSPADLGGQPRLPGKPSEGPAGPPLD